MDKVLYGYEDFTHYNKMKYL